MLLELIATFCFIVSCIPFLASAVWLTWSKRTRHIPRIPRRWPIVGNAFQLSMNQCHLVFTEWSKRYGAVFEVKLFNEKIVVLNDYNSIHEALVQAGATFAGRPKMHRTDQKQRYKKSIVWQTYTQKLVFLRKVVHKSLKMYGLGLLALEDVCRPELESLVNRIQQMDGTAFDPSRIFFDSVGNVMLYFVSYTSFMQYYRWSMKLYLCIAVEFIILLRGVNKLYAFYSLLDFALTLTGRRLRPSEP